MSMEFEADRLPLPRRGVQWHGGDRLTLLGRFELARRAVALPLAPGAQRLVAYVALRAQPVTRDLAAGTLWPAVDEERAHACLRSALTRLGEASDVVEAQTVEIALAAGVSVDFSDALATGQRLLGPGPYVATDSAAAIPALSAELLPGWYEDWVLADAERWRQLRLHALEVAAGVLAAAGRFGEAVGAAGAAVAGDPLRESACAALIRVHLSEGNQSEAVREFERYRDVLRSELGLEPTERMRLLVPVAPAR
jgi:SARP family transcriptional regulator, regulator of embCAB operon